MKKKILISLMLVVGLVCFTACGRKNLNLADHVIEQRNNLFAAQDDVYSVTLSTGLRESDYNLDGVKTEMVPFGVLSISRKDNRPMTNDEYSYKVIINDQEYSGTMEKSTAYNSCSADIGTNAENDATINVQIRFTGYTFNKDMANISNDFSVDAESALKIANNELNEQLNTLAADKNVGVEVVMKIVSDYSSKDVQHYYWYVGVITTNTETMGVLVDATTGEVVSKKI